MYGNMNKVRVDQLRTFWWFILLEIWKNVANMSDCLLWDGMFLSHFFNEQLWMFNTLAGGPYCLILLYYLHYRNALKSHELSTNNNLCTNVQPYLYHIKIEPTCYITARITYFHCVVKQVLKFSLYKNISRKQEET